MQDDSNQALGIGNVAKHITNYTSNISTPTNSFTNFTPNVSTATTTVNCSVLCVCSVVFYVVIIVVALAGNVLVLYAFAANKKIRESLATYFIVSLAVSDMFTASVVMPFDLEVVVVGYTWRHGLLVCSIWTTLYLLMVPTSILNLLALTVDRYKTLSDPLNQFKESPFMTKGKALAIIAGIWIYSMSFALIPELGWKIYSSALVDGICVFNISPAYSMLSSVVNFFIPIVSMCILYLQMYRIAITKNDTNGILEIAEMRTRSSSSLHIKKKQRIFLRNKRAAKTVLTIVCTFVMCWMPYTIFSLVNAACFTCFHVPGVESISTVFLIMGYSNSALNPFLFGLTHPLFKNTFKMVFKRLVTKVRSSSVTSITSNNSSASLSYRITRSGSVLIDSPTEKEF